MNDNLKSKTVCVFDNGLFIEWARKFVGEFDRVLYYAPFKSAFPRSNMYIVGEGLPGIERVRDFWDIIDEVDLFVFPDVYDGDLQLHLRDLGKRVWGGGKGEELELYRYEAKDAIRRAGLPVQPVKRVVGLDALREHLQQVNNKYIKVSYFRGDTETFHHDDYELTEPKLDELEYKLGPKKTVMEFVVEDAIDEAVEAGYDGFCIDGQFPSIAMQGYEIKDAGLIGVVKDYNDFPEPVKIVNDKLVPYFKGYNYRGFYSSEVRVTKDGTPYLTDPCTRAGSPPNELYLELYSNWPEIIWHGAAGELVEPKPVAKFGVEVMIHSTWADKNWQSLIFPPEIERWVKLRNLTKLGDKYYIAPQDVGLPEIGAVVAVDDTLAGAIKKVKERAEQVRGYQIDIKLDSIPAALEEIRQGEERGLPFSKNLPTPEEVAKLIV